MGELCDQIDGLQKQLKWAEEQLSALNADHDLVLADNERLNIRVAELEAREARLVAALTRIAEWAETADADEFVNGLPQTAKIARGALSEVRKNSDG